MNQTWIQFFRHKRDHKQAISINMGQRLPVFHPNSSSYSWVRSWIYFPTSSTGGVATCLSPSQCTVGGNDVRPFQCLWDPAACSCLLLAGWDGEITNTWASCVEVAEPSRALGESGPRGLVTFRTGTRVGNRLLLFTSIIHSSQVALRNINVEEIYWHGNVFTIYSKRRISLKLY